MSTTPVVSPIMDSPESFNSPMKRSKSSTNIKSKISQYNSRSANAGSTGNSNILNISSANALESKYSAGLSTSPTSKVHTNKFKFLDQEYLNELSLIIERNFESFEEKIVAVLAAYNEANSADNKSLDSLLSENEDKNDITNEIKSLVLEIIDRSKNNNTSLVSLNENLVKFNENISNEDSIKSLSVSLHEMLENISASETKIQSMIEFNSEKTMEKWRLYIEENSTKIFEQLKHKSYETEKVQDSLIQELTSLVDTIKENIEKKSLITQENIEKNFLATQKNIEKSYSKFQKNQDIDTSISTLNDSISLKIEELRHNLVNEIGNSARGDGSIDEYKKALQTLSTKFDELQSDLSKRLGTNVAKQETIENHFERIGDAVQSVQSNFETHLKELKSLLPSKIPSVEDFKLLERNLHPHLETIKSLVGDSNNNGKDLNDSLKQFFITEMNKSFDSHSDAQLKQYDQKFSDLTQNIAAWKSENQDLQKSLLNQELSKLHQSFSDYNQESQSLAKTNIELLSNLQGAIEKNTNTEELQKMIENSSSKSLIEEIHNKLGSLKEKMPSEEQICSKIDMALAEQTKEILLEFSLKFGVSTDDISAAIKNSMEALQSTKVMEQLLENRALLQSVNEEKDGEIKRLQQLVESQNKEIQELKMKHECFDEIKTLRQQKEQLVADVDDLNKDKIELKNLLHSISSQFVNLKTKVDSLSSQKEELVKSIESIERTCTKNISSNNEHNETLGNMMLNIPKQRKMKDITNEMGNMDKENKSLGKKRNFTTGVV